MQNMVQDGRSIGFVNTGEAVIPGGSLLVIGEMAGVPYADIAPGALGNVAGEGVFRLPKLDEAVSQGARLYVDPATGTLTVEATTTTGAGGSAVTTANIPAGVAWKAAAAGDATADVKINA